MTLPDGGYSALIMWCPRCEAIHHSEPIPPDVRYVSLERALSAFAPLLAVAKDAWDHRDHACTKPHPGLDAALAQLDTQHPGWREWSA